MPRRLAKSAKLIQTLVFYDAPQLALFETDRDSKMIALAVGDVSKSNAFFACEASDKAFRAYVNGRIDLNFLFRFSTGRHLYFFNWSDMRDNVVLLRPASLDEISNMSLYPDRGFFEEDHTHEWKIHTTHAARRQFQIDGKWDADDFSRFYNKIGDIYSFLSLVEDLDSPSTSVEEKKNIKNALTDPSWRGGGSYVGFYQEITSHSKATRPLRVSGIEYHSPGHIEVEGRASVFNNIGDVIISYEIHEQTIKELYSSLYATLAREDLRSADKNKEFSAKAVERFVQKSTTKLSEYLNVHNPNAILEICDKNVLVYCKVILSYYRRIRDFYLFEREGRLTLNRDPVANGPSAATKPDAPARH